MIGLDTGFFVVLLQGNKVSGNLWQKLMEGDEQSVVSCLSLFEIKKLSLKGAIDKKSADVLLEAIPSVCEIIWLNNVEIFMAGAKFSYSSGIPSVDSLILTSLLKANCRKIYTTDKHLQSYKKKGVKIINLRMP